MATGRSLPRAPSGRHSRVVHDAFLATARRLLESAGSTDADRRRAVSTAYYALLHALCRLVADSRPAPAGATWDQVYRGLAHAETKRRCSANRLLAASFSEPVQRIGGAFIQLQDARHLADYDPTYALSVEAAEIHIAAAGDALNRLAELRDETRHGFAAYLEQAPRK